MSYIINSIFNIRFSDIADILVLAFLIYKLLYYIRQTRAKNLLKGIFVIMLVWALAEVLDFTVIKFLISNLMTLGLIILVIVFQPELRVGLEKLGRGGNYIQENLITGTKNYDKDMIDELLIAVSDLAINKTGALIVIERETPLGDIIESGQVIDAKVNASLITNLFFKNSPLHDGAIVLRNGGIAAASCILPLTNNIISKNLGTRHRAAMGLVERTDAVVIVVSEETGTISIASDGKLARFVDVAGLESFLNSKFASESKNPFFKEVFTKFKKNRGEKNAK